MDMGPAGRHRVILFFLGRLSNEIRVYRYGPPTPPSCSWAEEAGGKVNDITDLAVITRLGERLKRTGILSAAAMDRTVSVLKDYKEKAVSYGVDEILCVGTAAMRGGPVTAALFAKRIKEELDISVRIITGKEGSVLYISVGGPATA